MALEAAMALATDDEWWTTDRVCAHLKLSKRALWDLRAHPTKAFPAAIKPGGKINLFRADDVRAWMAAHAQGSAMAVEPSLPSSPPPATSPATEPSLTNASLDLADAARAQSAPQNKAAAQLHNPAKKSKAYDTNQLTLF
jgi:predicted DNA-binding transcriptional regulator AlpA